VVVDELVVSCVLSVRPFAPVSAAQRSARSSSARPAPDFRASGVTKRSFRTQSRFIETEENDGYSWVKPTIAPSTTARKITDSPRLKRSARNVRAPARSDGCP